MCDLCYIDPRSFTLQCSMIRILGEKNDANSAALNALLGDFNALLSDFITPC